MKACPTQTPALRIPMGHPRCGAVPCCATFAPPKLCQCPRSCPARRLSSHGRMVEPFAPAGPPRRGLRQNPPRLLPPQPPLLHRRRPKEISPVPPLSPTPHPTHAQQSAKPDVSATPPAARRSHSQRGCRAVKRGRSREGWGVGEREFRRGRACGGGGGCRRRRATGPPPQ